MFKLTEYRLCKSPHLGLKCVSFQSIIPKCQFDILETKYQICSFAPTQSSCLRPSTQFQNIFLRSNSLRRKEGVALATTDLAMQSPYLVTYPITLSTTASTLATIPSQNYLRHFVGALPPVVPSKS